MEKYRDQVKCLNHQGAIIDLDTYQKEYGLKGTKIGQYFNYTEPRFLQDIYDYDELIVCIPLMTILDLYRQNKKAPVFVNSFNRNDQKQKELAAKGYKTAKFSPHVFKLAADVDTLTPEETKYDANLILDIAKDYGIPIRVGYKQYLKNAQTFIHIDVCPYYFAPGRPFNSIKHPHVWEYNFRTW